MAHFKMFLHRQLVVMRFSELNFISSMAPLFSPGEIVKRFSCFLLPFFECPKYEKTTNWNSYTYTLARKIKINHVQDVSANFVSPEDFLSTFRRVIFDTGCYVGRPYGIIRTNDVISSDLQTRIET